MRVTNQSYIFQMNQLNKTMLDQSDDVTRQLQTSQKTKDLADVGSKNIRQFRDAQLMIEKHENYALNIEVAQSRFEGFLKVFEQFETLLDDVYTSVIDATNRDDDSATIMANLADDYLREVEALLNSKIQDNFYLFNGRDGRKADADIRFFEASDGSYRVVDDVAGAENGYALRRLSETYAGDAIQVIRTSDFATLDVGFDDKGRLDVNALEDFLHGTTGQVSIWYDQIGGDNLTPIAPGFRPTIVLDHFGEGKPGLYFDGTDGMSSSTGANASAAVTGVVDYVSGTQVWEGSAAGSFQLNGATDTATFTGGSIVNTDFDVGAQVVSQVEDGVNSSFRVDGATNNSTLTGTPASTLSNFRLMDLAEYYTSEIVIYSGPPPSANLLDIEAAVQHGTLKGTLDTSKYGYADGAPLPSVVTTLSAATLGAYNHFYSHDVHLEDETQTYGGYDFDTSDTMTVDISMSAYEPFIQNLVMGFDVARKAIETSEPGATGYTNFDTLKQTAEQLLDAARTGLQQAKNKINSQHNMLENQKQVHDQTVEIYESIIGGVDDVDSEALAADLLTLRNRIELSFQTTSSMNNLSFYRFL